MKNEEAVQAITAEVNAKLTDADARLGVARFQASASRWTRGSLTVTLGEGHVHVFYQPGFGNGPIPVRMNPGEISQEDARRAARAIVDLLCSPAVGA